MRSCAEPCALALALVLGLGTPAGARAQQAGPDPADARAPAARVEAAAVRPASAPPSTWTPPAEVARDVVAQVAAAWQVDPGLVRIDWGHLVPAAAGAPRLRSLSPQGVLLLDLGSARLALRAGVRVPRAVAARALRRGDTLAAADLVPDSTVAWGDPRAATPEPTPRPGWQVNRALAAGEPLTPPSVTPPPALRAGARVRAVYSAGELRVTIAATAVADAVAGRPVPLRTDDGRRLVGVVAEDGTVRISQASAQERGRP